MKYQRFQPLGCKDIGKNAFPLQGYGITSIYLLKTLCIRYTIDRSKSKICMINIQVVSGRKPSMKSRLITIKGIVKEKLKMV